MYFSRGESAVGSLAKWVTFKRIEGPRAGRVVPCKRFYRCNLHSRFDVGAGFCPYETLGVERDCSQRELRSAYLSKVMQHHPDRMHNTKCNISLENSKKNFFSIQKAYEILNSPEIRTEWDTLSRSRAEHKPQSHSQARREDYFKNFEADAFNTSRESFTNDQDEYIRHEFDARTYSKALLVIAVICILTGEYLNIKMERLKTQMIRMPQINRAATVINFSSGRRPCA